MATRWAEDVTQMQAGPAMDRLVAEQVLGWHCWVEGEVTDTRTFVVNPITQHIERCLPYSMALGSAYPECSKTYAFSTNREDALEVLRVVPIEAMPGVPHDALALCRLALQWTQRMMT